MCTRSKGGFRKLGLCSIAVLTFGALSAFWCLAQDNTVGSAIRAQIPQSPPSNPQPKSDPPKTIQLRVQSNMVTTPVTVINRATGEYVYNLTKDDFRIYDNGIQQQIQRFDWASHKLATVLVIQNSNSIAPLLGDVKQLAPLFSQLMLGPNGESAVLFFSDNIQKVQDFSNSDDVLDKSLHSIKPGGTKARLNDALMQAMNMLEPRPRDERRVIVVLSTGYDSGSVSAKDEVIRRASASEVEIYGLGLSLAKGFWNRKPEPQVAMDPLDQNVTGPHIPGTVQTPSASTQQRGVPTNPTQGIEAIARAGKSKVFDNDMETYTHYTGGVFYAQWSSSALQMNLSKIASEIHGQYEVAYVPDNLAKVGFHRLEVKVNRPDVKVRARPGYFYLGPKR